MAQLGLKSLKLRVDLLPASALHAILRNRSATAFLGPRDRVSKPPFSAPRYGDQTMKLTIERAAILKALAHVQSVVERRNTIPILSNVLITAQKGRLSLAATDMDLAITETVEASAGKTGSTTAPAHTLYEIVRKLPDGAQVELETASDGGSLA